LIQKPVRVAVALLVLTLPLIILVIRRAPDTAPGDHLAANLRLNRPVQALYQIEYTAAQTGWTPEMARRAGDLWDALGDRAKAAAFWEIASPKNAAVLRQLAEAYLSLGRWPEAADTFRRLLALEPNAADAHEALGLLLAASDPRTAAGHLRQAASQPTFAPLANELGPVLDNTTASAGLAMQAGAILAARERWLYAEVAFSYASTVSGPYPQALAWLALARDKQGKDGGPQIQQAVALAPQDGQVRYLEGLHLRAGGAPRESLRALYQAVTLDPLNPAFAAELGSAYQLVGDRDHAALWLKQAVALSHGDPRFQDLYTQFEAENPAR
jgi:tetratricopeptide (TPR) repeat protein